MDNCEICGNVAEVSAILDGEVQMLCRNCANVNKAATIEKATKQQMNNINKSSSVYDRLSKMAGIQAQAREEMMRSRVKTVLPTELRERKWKTAEEKSLEEKQRWDNLLKIEEDKKREAEEEEALRLAQEAERLKPKGFAKLKNLFSFGKKQKQEENIVEQEDINLQ